MPASEPAISPLKKFVFVTIMLAIPLLVAAMAVGGYYGYRKLTLSYEYCGSYSLFDDELGWRLRPGASSCLALRNRLKGITYFDTRIYTDSGGFRSAKPGTAVPERAIMAVGDSWTFGYGVDFDASFPSYLSRSLGAPVINAGIPAYGSGSTVLLATRSAERYRPRVLVYYTHGLYERSLCAEQEAQATLIPCYAYDPGKDRIAFVVPKPGAVSDAVRNHVYPGGSLTAGYDSLWRFAVNVKIPEMATHARSLLLGAFGAAPKSHQRDPRHKTRAIAYELRQYATLANRLGFGFVLVDPADDYAETFAAISKDFANGAIRIGRPEWASNVRGPMAQLPAEEARVPMDGHYGRGANRIIGEYIAAAIREGLPERLREIGN